MFRTYIFRSLQLQNSDFLYKIAAYLQCSETFLFITSLDLSKHKDWQEFMYKERKCFLLDLLT